MYYSTISSTQKSCYKEESETASLFYRVYNSFVFIAGYRTVNNDVFV